jgi:hypothetical protein
LARQVGDFAVSALVDEVISALRLCASAVAWKASEDIRQTPEVQAAFQRVAQAQRPQS